MLTGLLSPSGGMCDLSVLYKPAAYADILAKCPTSTLLVKCNVQLYLVTTWFLSKAKSNLLNVNKLIEKPYQQMNATHILDNCYAQKECSSCSDRL